MAERTGKAVGSIDGCGIGDRWQVQLVAASGLDG